MDEIDRGMILGVMIWWSREHRCYIATAPATAGVIGAGDSFAEAAFNLEEALKIFRLFGDE